MIFDSRLLIKKFKYFYLKMSQNVYSFRYYIQNPDLRKNTGGDSLSNRLSDADKVELLYELYEKDMFRICVSVLRDPYEAEDALSECFVKLIKARDKIDDPRSQSCKRFAMKTAKNTAIDVYRKKSKEREHIGEMPEKEPTCDAVDTVFDTFSVAQIYELIDTLSPKYRAVIECISIEKLSVCETAAVLRISESCVRKRLERARSKLTEGLKADSENSEMRNLSYPKL